MEAVGLFPGQQNLSGGACAHGERGAHGDRVAQAHLAFGRGHAHAVISLAAEELGGFLRVVAQRLEDRHGCLEEAVFAGGGGELLEAGAEDKTSLHVAGDHAVVFEGNGQSVGGGACEPRTGNELGEGGGSCFKSAENQRSLVKNANATGCLLFHTTI